MRENIDRLANFEEDIFDDNEPAKPIEIFDAGIDAPIYRHHVAGCSATCFADVLFPCW